MVVALILILLTGGDTNRFYEHKNRVGVNSDTLLPSDTYDEFFTEIPAYETQFDETVSDRQGTDLLDQLLWLREHPYDLNHITRDELTTLPGFTESEASAVIRSRTMVKRFTSLEQLLLIEGSGQQIYQKLRPYIYVRDANGRRSAGSSVELRTRMMRHVPSDQPPGVEFMGPRFASYSRLSANILPSVTAGGLFEKEDGEQFSHGFLSGYLTVRAPPILQQVIVGDFVVEAGQGLALWRASAFGKGSGAAITPKRSGGGPQPYRSTDEFQHLRGIAVTSDVELGGGAFRLSVFRSQRSLSANVGDGGAITGFYKEGLYRTIGELQKRDAVEELLTGGRLQFSVPDGIRFGVTYYQSLFDKPVMTRSPFSSPMRKTDVAGFDADVQQGRFTFFGEIASSARRTFAGLMGTVVELGREALITFVYRDYSPRFNNLHANGFGENGDTNNEQGLYVAWTLPLGRRGRVSLFVDQFKYPWRTSFNPLPVSGHDVVLQAETVASEKLSLSFRLQKRTMEYTEADRDVSGRETKSIVDRSRWRCRLIATARPDPHLHCRTLLETAMVEFALPRRNERGFLACEQLLYRVSSALSIGVCLVFFEADSYESRMYSGEPDLAGMFSNVSLSGKGRRWYMMLRYTARKLYHLSMKYSETDTDGEVLGSILKGSEQRGLMTLQLDVKF